MMLEKSPKNSISNLKKDAELRKQRPTKVPLHYRDRLEILLNELQRARIIREMGSDVEMGSLFTNPIIILPKGDTVKLVIATRYLKFSTDLSNYSWPPEPLQMLLTRLDGVYYATSDLIQPTIKYLFQRTQRN